MPPAVQQGVRVAAAARVVATVQHRLVRARLRQRPRRAARRARDQLRVQHVAAEQSIRPSAALRLLAERVRVADLDRIVAFSSRHRAV